MTTSDECTVWLERHGDGVAVVTLNRPSALNAMNAQLKAELAGVIADLAADDSVRAVVLTGAGRAFCAGGDITEMDPARAPDVTRQRQMKLLTEVFGPLHRLPKPVVAAINGHAHGGGLALALACDIVLAGEGAAMSLGFVQRGIAADCGITYFLPRRIGIGRSKVLLYTGRRFTASEALAMGIVEQVVPDAEVLSQARALAASLAGGATTSIALTKTLLDRSHRVDFEEFAELESYAQAVSRSTDDHREGVVSFLDKRAAVFTGS